MAFSLQTKYMDWVSSPQSLLNDSLEYQEQSNNLRRINALRATEQAVFESVGLIIEKDYHIHDVMINDREWVHTVQLIPIGEAKEIFYMVHGFGGTSLFYYQIAAKLRRYGEVILMDLRGMGFSSKYCPPLQSVYHIKQYFVEPFECVKQFYCHKSITLVGHSFGSYVSMLYSSQYPDQVKRQVLFAPIGITPKQLDYKAKIRNFSDIWNYFVSQLGWKFQLTYKTMLKYFACFCKKGALKSSFRKYGGNQSTVQNLSEIVLRLYDEPLCSERLFFRLFEPRVLPNYNLLEHYSRAPCTTPTALIYGQKDWVDKSGAKTLQSTYPTIFKLIDLKEISHQIFFECRPNLEQELLNIILTM